MNWHKLSVENANQIIEINKKGEKVASLEAYVDEEKISENKIFENVVGQDSLTRFDKPKQNNNRRRNNRNRKRNTNKNSNRNQKKNV